MLPRNTLDSTRAVSQLRRKFFTEYLHARTLNGNDRMVGPAVAIFEENFHNSLLEALGPTPLDTPLILTDRLSNRVLAVHAVVGSLERVIILNVRFKVDPEVLAHALVEEYVHAKQVLDGIDFDDERSQFPDYASRPYERAAKQLATFLLGYLPADFDVFLLRDEPNLILYDVPTIRS